MEMMNRAIEDASDFRDMLKKLVETQPMLRGTIPRALKVVGQAKPAKRAGENRQQYRARVHARQEA